VSDSLAPRYNYLAPDGNGCSHGDAASDPDACTNRCYTDFDAMSYSYADTHSPPFDTRAEDT
jgi:hypothetical protein